MFCGVRLLLSQWPRTRRLSLRAKNTGAADSRASGATCASKPLYAGRALQRVEAYVVLHKYNYLHRPCSATPPK